MVFAVGCNPAKTVQTTKPAGDDQRIEVVFLQLNDVYEIAPLENGKVGGLARVATVRQTLKQQNPNTYTIMCGDFFNPSVFGTLKYEGSSIRGRQMVETLNVMGLDLATFGNHEFDLKEADFQARLNELTFGWVCANAKHKSGGEVRPFTYGHKFVPETVPSATILTAQDADGTSVRIGVLGVVIPLTKADYVLYEDIDLSMRAAYQQIKSQTDFVVAITHLSIDQDKQLATQIPDVPLFMGGHEHENTLQKVGKVRIAKADANAKTVYIHRLAYDKRTKQVSIESELKPITDALPDEPTTATTVQKWMGIADQSFAQMGFNPKEVVMSLPAGQSLDGREATIRTRPAELCQMITRAMHLGTSQTRAAIMNSGSVRVDDELQGQITQYDVLRTLPFGGSVVTVELKGRLLNQILAAGEKNVGSGGYLQYSNIQPNPNQANQWLIGKEVIDPQATYRIAFSDFLLTGGEKNLDFLKPDNPDIVKVERPTEGSILNDIRLTWIDYLKKGGK